MHLQPTHTHILHSASSQIPVWNPVGGLWWGFIAETVYVLRSLAVSQRNSIVDVWRNSKCDSVFGEGFHHWGYIGESWTPPASWFSWFKPNANTRRWNLGLNPRPHFLEGEFIHLVDKAKNVWLIVGQLPIKAGWWNTPLALLDFSQRFSQRITLIPCIAPILCISIPIPCIASLISHIPTLIRCVLIISAILHWDSTFRVLQIVDFVKRQTKETVLSSFRQYKKPHENVFLRKKFQLYQVLVNFTIS